MSSNLFDLIPLDSNFGLKHLLTRLEDCFGLVFLQDDTFPVIGVLPQYLVEMDTNRKFVRQIDGSYQQFEHNESLKLNLTTVQEDIPFQGFHGGYIAFLSYDYAAKQHGIELQTYQQPSAIIGEYDIFLKQIDGIWQLYIEQSLKDHCYIQNLIARLEQSISSKQNFRLATPLQARWSKAEYQAVFNKIQDYLYAGDCYQINLTQEFSAQVQSGQLGSLLPELLQLTHAPFAGYLKFQDFELLSCSPELFIEFQPNRVLRTRPIKGTLPRHQNIDIDAENRQQLANSEKDKAENLMIVDLLRNDLSVYAKTGSVHVPHLFEIESFAQVHHMVSEIQATLKDDVDLFEVLTAALPGGSITGAPKIRAMQIIEELEGNARGAYCGSLGYLNYDGTGRFNILIRTIQRYGDDLSIWAGGGITVASNVDAEYQECLDKVNALIEFLNKYAETS